MLVTVPSRSCCDRGGQDDVGVGERRAAVTVTMTTLAASSASRAAIHVEHVAEQATAEQQ